ncbi:MAG TPA: hypothetical protein VJ986_00360 [Gaiellaceae bacterium]|nr:hypothetical protein [Gaiellaceae bacterium]
MGAAGVVARVVFAVDAEIFGFRCRCRCRCLPCFDAAWLDVLFT